MRHGMRKPYILKVKGSGAHMINLNEYWDVLPEAKAGDFLLYGVK